MIYLNVDKQMLYVFKKSPRLSLQAGQWELKKKDLNIPVDTIRTHWDPKTVKYWNAEKTSLFFKAYWITWAWEKSKCGRVP